MAPFTDGFVSFGGYKTWYQTAGDLRAGRPSCCCTAPARHPGQLLRSADGRPGRFATGGAIRPARMRALRPAERPLALACRDLPRRARGASRRARARRHPPAGTLLGRHARDRVPAQEAIRRAKPGALELAVQHAVLGRGGAPPARRHARTYRRVDAPLRRTPPSDRSGRPCASSRCGLASRRKMSSAGRG